MVSQKLGRHTLGCTDPPRMATRHLQEGQQLLFRGGNLTEPLSPLVLGQDDQHPVMNLAHHFIRPAGQDGGQLSASLPATSGLSTSPRAWPSPDTRDLPRSAEGAAYSVQRRFHGEGQQEVRGTAMDGDGAHSTTTRRPIRSAPQSPRAACLQCHRQDRK
jgi:hypothetical protein